MNGLENMMNKVDIIIIVRTTGESKWDESEYETFNNQSFNNKPFNNPNNNKDDMDYLKLN